jgi:histidine triad (HIT) family protein
VAGYDALILIVHPIPDMIVRRAKAAGRNEKRSRTMAGEPQADCLFCKIVAGDVPATVVRETETTVAFRDINPQAPTHVLVIPRAHYADAATLAAAEPGIAADVLRESAEVAAGDKVDAGGYRVVFNTGSGAGQTVFHAHAHVLGGRGLNWPPG